MNRRINSMTVGRVFKLAEFESLRIELSCDVYEGETAEEVYDEILLVCEKLKERKPSKKPKRTLKRSK